MPGSGFMQKCRLEQGGTSFSLPQCVVPPPFETFLQSEIQAAVIHSSLSGTADKELLVKLT